MGILRHFWTYVPPEPPPEVPEVEPPDPSDNRALTESYRGARRSLVVVCALCAAWGTAQFSLADPRIAFAGLSIDPKDASIPLLLAGALSYFVTRWGFEFAMMSRHVRQWRLAQLDFRLVSIVVRISLMVLAAGAVDRSSRTVSTVTMVLVELAVVVSVLTLLLMFVTMPVRIRARARADRPSAASAAFEAIFWAGFFSVCLTVLATVATAIASYYYAPWRSLFWRGSPDPVALATFVLVLIVVFLSHWLLRPVMNALFAKRPSY